MDCIVRKSRAIRESRGWISLGGRRIRKFGEFRVVSVYIDWNYLGGARSTHDDIKYQSTLEKNYCDSRRVVPTRGPEKKVKMGIISERWCGEENNNQERRAQHRPTQLEWLKPPR